MVFDSVGLGYVGRNGAVWVSYPARLPSGEATYGGGFPIGTVPVAYWSHPPNAITAERVELWRALIEPPAPRPM
jgi:hypothetical protein